MMWLTIIICLNLSELSEVLLVSAQHLCILSRPKVEVQLNFAENWAVFDPIFGTTIVLTKVYAQELIQ